MRYVCFVVILVSLTACRQDLRPDTSTRSQPGPQAAPQTAQQHVPASDTAAPLPAGASFADVVDRVAPAVVTIRSARRVRAPQQFPFFDDPFFRRFFGERNPETPRRGPAPVQQGIGSGVIVRADGYILTNHHVIDGADEIRIDLTDRRTYPAKLVGSDPPSDLAVLKVNASNMPVLTLADSDRVRVGDACLALGNPLGLGQTVTSGIISAKGRATGLSNGSFEDFLQTDAPINRGNSGGALVNTAGQLIGINSQILSTTGGNIGIGFAIPTNMARNVMEQLIETGKVRRGQLGVAVQPITSDLAEQAGLREVRGVFIADVSSGGPADRAGLRAGDVVTAVDGTPVEDANAFRNRIASTQPGTEVTLTVMRNGRTEERRARLGELTVETAAEDRRRGR
jgi:Do/DeqQ family serine protease